MHILFLSHYFPPEVNAPAARTYEHAVRWVAAGHEVTIVTCAPNCPDGVLFEGYRNTWRPRVEWVDGIRVVRVWTYLAPNAGTVRRIANYLSYMVSAVLGSLRLARPDVVVATSPQFFCGWAGVLTSWLRWRPLVLEIRDIWPESIEVLGAIRSRPLLWALRRLERLMYRAANHIVAVGPGYREKILEKVWLPERISVIPNGVDPERFRPQPPDERFLHMWNLEGKFVCSYVGTIGMAHGLEVVVEAAKILRERGRDDIAFCLVGDGARRAVLEEQCRQLRLDRWVVFTGRQPREAVPGILASSNACLIHLRRCDLFTTVLPSKIFETMAMGCPIVVGVEGPAAEMASSAGVGVAMEPESAESLVNAVTNMADNRVRTEKMGKMGRGYIVGNYNRNKLAELYLRCLERIATRSGRPSAALPGSALAAEADSTDGSSLARDVEPECSEKNLPIGPR